jgi:hypothetical protein
VEVYVVEKMNSKRQRKISRLFILLSRVLFIIDEEDTYVGTRRFKSGMMFSSSDRVALSLRFDRDSLFFT